jgi:protein-tyrosine phosphatase
MDRSNHDDLLALAPDEVARERVRLLREYDPEAVAAGELEVPDPYYGDGDGFEDVLDLVTRACQGLIEVEVRPRVA